MGFLGKMFGSEKALGGIVDGVTKGLDALVYTSEEKAQDAAKERSEARGMVVQWMASTQGQNISRRFIAISTTMVWLSMIIIGFTVSIAGIWLDGDPEKIKQTIEVAESTRDDMSPVVMLVFAFYFAAPHMGKMATAFIENRAAKLKAK